ncbi:MAG: ribosomal-protein-alanine N-acetyltransferase [Bdellovibrionaceae bacterium]|nr:ribosomal-protein-alanine N-acetyltransferase [Pseudobdellovibrionaceae bacterium]|tara:strand:- start:2829 stop:3326 length:498 start_codon:yes stop_codon:yes gene_type:complete
MNLMSLRPADEDDIESMVRIEKSVHPSPWNAQHFLEELNKSFSTLWVYTDDETDSLVYGYICFWEMDKELQILNVAVDPQKKRQGLGHGLVQKVISYGIKNQLKRIFLNVRKSNDPAIALYQKCQFQITHVRKNFYSHSEDAYEMEVRLDGGERVPEVPVSRKIH